MRRSLGLGLVRERGRRFEEGWVEGICGFPGGALDEAIITTRYLHVAFRHSCKVIVQP